jgi:bifunctional DNA-binding transcriptional regulator/antitoxin component of YhaV-PrlF toxin-antitoxin module
MKTNGKEKKDLVRYYNTVRVSAKGQLVLPKEYRDEQHIEAGSPMAALRFGTGLLLLPEMEKFDALCRSIEKVITSHDLTADDFLETLVDTRKELFSEMYPGAAKK